MLDLGLKPRAMTLRSGLSLPLPLPPPLPIIAPIPATHIPPSSLFSGPDVKNYLLLLTLYILQGIPIGLTSTIPLLIIQKGKSTTQITNAQAMFALSSWPFSLKLLWAPLVDVFYSSSIGRRKSWLLPTQLIAGLLLVRQSEYISSSLSPLHPHVNLDPIYITTTFFIIYLLLATQDIAVDAWALTILKRENRPNGPLCNTIGQSIGVFLSYTGYLTLSDPNVADNYIRPFFKMLGIGGLLGLSDGTGGLVSFNGFLKWSGYFMVGVTVFVGIFKREGRSDDGDDENYDDDGDTESSLLSQTSSAAKNKNKATSFERKKDFTSQLSNLRQTYAKLYSITLLPSVRTLILILLTYRIPFALSDNVKILKLTQLGLPNSVLAVVNTCVTLPLGVLTPVIARYFFKNKILEQFLFGFKVRLILLPIVDVVTMFVIGITYTKSSSESMSMSTLTSTSTSTQYEYLNSQPLALLLLTLTLSIQTITTSLQINSLMQFFSIKSDPNIGGSYMTLLNTFANLGGTWPAAPVIFFFGFFDGMCGGMGYVYGSLVLGVCGGAWLWAMEDKVRGLEGGGEMWVVNEGEKGSEVKSE